MPNDDWRVGRRVRRFFVATVKVVALLVLLAVCAAFAYERIGAWRDARVLVQVGRSVDIGGRSLNISCSGTGGPTVVFESGRDAPGYIWTPTQRGVAAFTRACWYDRATVGWSDPGPDPGWGDSAAHDLHQLLHNAGIAPPLVLVGHSFGGYIVRFYNQFYPGEVAGMVFVDTALEDAGTVRGMPHKNPPPLPRRVINGLSLVLGNLGMMRWIAADPGSPPTDWTAGEWDILFRLRRQGKILLADAHQGPEQATAERVRKIGGLENMPMIVLTHGRPVDAQFKDGWVDLQRRFTATSRRGRQVLVPGGHGIPEESPGTIVAAVRDIVVTVRSERQ
jgi:pimeloyl-ACP methyl ester carboxylesterase